VGAASRGRPPLVIVNPVAGGGRALRFWQACRREIDSRHVIVDETVTRYRGQAAEIAAGASDRLVVVVGGDGSVHDAVQGLLAGSPTPRPRLGVLQRGTGSDLSRSVPAPRTPSAVARWLQSYRYWTVDAGVVETSTGRHFFLNAADAGIGAAVVRRAEHGVRRLGGTVNFLLAALITLLRHQNQLIRLQLDGQAAPPIRVRTVAVANGRCFGGGMRIAPTARLDDGLLDVVVIGDISRWLGIRSLPLLYRGTHGRLQQVRFSQARTLRIEADMPLAIQADGELVGETPAEFRVLPAALDLLRWDG
jgi:YegS/Rv2252/BmrU family lipid kinase